VKKTLSLTAWKRRRKEKNPFLFPVGGRRGRNHPKEKKSPSRKKSRERKALSFSHFAEEKRSLREKRGGGRKKNAFLSLEERGGHAYNVTIGRKGKGKEISLYWKEELPHTTIKREFQEGIVLSGEDKEGAYSS